MERRSTKRNTNPELTEAERRQADRAFWEQQGDPLQIEREEAIKLAKKFKNPSTNVDTHNTHNETNNMLYPTTVYGVTTPESCEPSQHSQQGAKALHSATLSEGSLSPDTQIKSTVEGETIYFDDNLSDVMRTSVQGNQPIDWADPLGLGLSNTQPVNHQLSLSWVVPDGLNKKLEDIETKTIANFASPGGGTGAMLVNLPALQPYYFTEHYLVDLDTGELFAQRHRLWYTTGLTCEARQFSPNEVDERIQRESERFRQKLDEEEQTEVEPVRQDTTQYLKLPTPIQSKQNTAILPNLPNLPDPSCFRIFTDVMQLQMRKNYLRDRRLAASSYILEYGATKIMAGKGQYDIDRLNQRLRIVFGKAEAIKRNIDTSLMQDDYHRRRRNMRSLGVPTRFPEPNHMENSPTNKWIHWINIEAEKLQAEINEEIKRVQDPDDPFNGTAGGVFQPLIQDLTGTGHKTENNIPATNEDSQVSEIEKEPTAVPLSQTLIDLDFNTVPQHTSATNKDPNVNRQLIPNLGTPERLQPNTNLATRLPATPTQNTIESLANGGEGATPRVTNIENTHKETPGQGVETDQVPPSEQQSERCEPSQPPRQYEQIQGQKGKDAIAERTEKINWKQPHYNQQNYNQQSYNQQGYNQYSYNHPSYNQAGHNQQSHKQPSYNQPKPDMLQRQQHNNMMNYNNRNPAYGNSRQRYKDEEGDSCGRCGEEGHYQENCYAYVKCDFCHIRTHNTTACRSYKNFVKAHPIASSRRNTPVNGYNAQKEVKQGTTVQYRPHTQIKEIYNEEAQYRTSSQVNQNNSNQQNHMAPNTLTTETYNKIHPNTTPHSYVQEQHKKELNQSQMEKQMQYNQPQVEKPVSRRTLSNENHHELYQAILKHLQESANQVQPPQPQPVPETVNPGITTKTKETRKEQAQTQTGKEEIHTEISKLLEKQRPVYVNYYYSQPLTGKYQAEGCEPSHPYHTETAHRQQTFQREEVPIEVQKASTQNPATDGTVIVQPWQSYTSIPIPNLNEPPPQKLTKDEKPMVKMTDSKEVTTTNENMMIEAVKEITRSIKDQLAFSTTEAMKNSQQNNNLMEQLIKAQERRDLDPALLAIPTFSGKDPEQCGEWIQRIKNVCRQSGRSLRQELINKSDLTVQTFIQALDEKMPEETIVDRLMEYFSDIKTSTQAMIKLKTMYQAKDESILLFNQKFRAVMERIDATSVDNIRSDLQINMYLESIKPSISKGIKGNRFYGNKYAPTTLGDAMKKAEEAYLKDIYVWGGREDMEEEQYGNPAKEVTVENIEDRQNRWSREDNGRKDFQRNPSSYRDNDRRGYQSNSWNRRERSEPSQPSQLPRGAYTQITVNPMQLDDRAFTAWIDRLVEAKKNRYNNVKRPFRNFRKPYNDNKDFSQPNTGKPQLKQYIKSAPELNVEEIQRCYQCTYEDIEEAVDLYNLDVEECRNA